MRRKYDEKNNLERLEIVEILARDSVFSDEPWLSKLIVDKFPTPIDQLQFEGETTFYKLGYRVNIIGTGDLIIRVNISDAINWESKKEIAVFENPWHGKKLVTETDFYKICLEQEKNAMLQGLGEIEKPASKKGGRRL